MNYNDWMDQLPDGPMPPTLVDELACDLRETNAVLFSSLTKEQYAMISVAFRRIVWSINAFDFLYDRWIANISIIAYDYLPLDKWLGVKVASPQDIINMLQVRAVDYVGFKTSPLWSCCALGPTMNEIDAFLRWYLGLSKRDVWPCFMHLLRGKRPGELQAWAQSLTKFCRLLDQADACARYEWEAAPSKWMTEYPLLLEIEDIDEFCQLPPEFVASLYHLHAWKEVEDVTDDLRCGPSGSQINWDVVRIILNSSVWTSIQPLMARVIKFPIRPEWGISLAINYKDFLDKVLCLCEQGWASWLPMLEKWIYNDIEFVVEGLLRSGVAALLGKLPELDSDELEMVFDSLAIHFSKGHVLAPADVKSWKKLRDTIMVSNESAIKERKLLNERKALHRSLDRLAQRSPGWAINRYPEQYERGKRLAPLYAQVIKFIRTKSEEYERIVVHLRDGEMICQLARRAKCASKLVPVLSSRPLTTEARKIPASFLAYLERVIPKGINACHVDTGFRGSIPDWFADWGWSVGEISLISAERPDRQMPLENLGTSHDIRRIVLKEIEQEQFDCYHRLEKIQKGAWETAFGESKIVYSEHSPGFWAMLYGICDALDLPYRA